MNWIRLNVSLDGVGLEYHRQARRMGLSIISIIHMSDLESAGWEAAFDRIYATYPGDIWEIASEISNPDPTVNPVPITATNYMSQFKTLYFYVKARYPGAVLTNAPPYGSGDTGAPELEEFFTLGLLDLNVVIALNVYSNYALSRYTAVMDKYADRLAGKRVWVTETGSANPNNQIAWVQEFYCDAVGITIGGPSFLKSFSHFFRTRSNDQYYVPRDEQLIVKMRGEIGEEARFESVSIALGDQKGIARSVVQYVARTAEPVLLANASV